MSDKVKNLIEEVKALTVLELSELVHALEEEFGVSAAAPMAVAAAPAAADGDGGAAVEEKSTYDVVISSVGDNKISVIKVVREITGLGLKEAKDLVDASPKAIKEGVSQEEADSMKAKLEGAGATVELK